MRNYIVDLDKLYQDELKKNADKKISKDFSIYVPLIVKIYGTQNGNFYMKRMSLQSIYILRMDAGCIFRMPIS